MKDGKEKTPIYGKTWFWIIIFILLFWVSTSSMCSGPAEKTEVESEEQQIVSTEEAYERAKMYLSIDGACFSRQGLIDQLFNEDGISPLIGEEAVEQLEKNGEVDWYVQAERSATNYINLLPMSRQELIDRLVYDDLYDLAEAEEAAFQLETNGKVDWTENAKKSAQVFLEFDDFDEGALFDALTSEDKYTEEEARAAIEAVR